MKNILCYGDSNTWGHNPDATVEGEWRLPHHSRWPNLVQKALGDGYHVVEEGLGGRTTMFEEPSSPGRNGLALLVPLMQSHQPLELIVFMLGTNDTKSTHSAPAGEIAMGMEALVKAAQNPFATDRRRAPEILIISPILVAKPAFFNLFDEGSMEKSRQLAPEYRRVAEAYGCHFLDAAQYASPSPKDNIHLDAAGHAALAAPVAAKIKEILG